MSKADIHMSKVRQQFQMNLREMEAFMEVSKPFAKDPHIGYIRNHIEVVIANLVLITKGIENIETSQNEFFGILN